MSSAQPDSALDMGMTTTDSTTIDSPRGFCVVPLDSDDAPHDAPDVDATDDPPAYSHTPRLFPLRFDGMHDNEANHARDGDEQLSNVTDLHHDVVPKVSGTPGFR